MVGYEMGRPGISTREALLLSTLYLKVPTDHVILGLALSTLESTLDNQSSLPSSYTLSAVFEYGQSPYARIYNTCVGDSSSSHASGPCPVNIFKKEWYDG